MFVEVSPWREFLIFSMLTFPKDWRLKFLPYFVSLNIPSFSGLASILQNFGIVSSIFSILAIYKDKMCQHRKYLKNQAYIIAILVEHRVVRLFLSPIDVLKTALSGVLFSLRSLFPSPFILRHQFFGFIFGRPVQSV